MRNATLQQISIIDGFLNPLGLVIIYFLFLSSSLNPIFFGNTSSPATATALTIGIKRHPYAPNYVHI